jgi:imidazolonepropionase-like amidohydrolase
MHRSYGYQPLSVFSTEVAQAFVKEAHTLGLRVFAHAHWDADYRLALDAGVDALMHSSFDPLAEETVARVRDAGIPVCPTLWVFHSACFGLEERWDRDPERGRGVVGAVRRSWTRYAEAYAASGDMVPEGIASGASKEQGREAIRVAAANLRLLHDAGVPFAFGSDGPFGFSVIGRPVDELGVWERAGLSREECLGYATKGSADLLGLDDRGTVAPGRRADLVVVDGDPRKQLTTLRQPSLVIRAGRAVQRRRRLENAFAVATGLGRTLLDAARDLARSE